MATHFVTIADKQCEVHVVRNSKTVWRAYGDFGGRQVEGKASSESAALKRWIEAARYWANQ
jgi:hypothetical protein